LPEAWDGVRIAHLSDFHVGSAGVSLDRLWAARRIAESFEPDVVALTGDFFDEGAYGDSHGLFVEWPGTASVFAVIGNHDSRAGDTPLDELVQHLAEGGVTVLRNDARAIDLRGHAAWIVGVDDPHTWLADEERAFAALPEDTEALLYLAHSPATEATMPIGRVRVVLCGHTHGGQFRILPSGRIPLINWLRRLKGTGAMNDPAISRGVHWRKGAIVVISNGLGLSQLPGRFLARPQLILIELGGLPDDARGCDDSRRYVKRLSPALSP
jgi:predicted MPP superfamily phosphohydrolase